MSWTDWVAMFAAVIAAVVGEVNRRKLGSVERATNGNLSDVKQELRSMRTQRDAVVAKVMERK